MNPFFPHEATTDGVTVRVAVSFEPERSAPAHGRFFWTYHIRVENHRTEAVQLRTRRWVITDGRGARHVVAGDGVIGEQPVIQPGGAYDYVSGCPLDTPTGAMQGSYGMVDGYGDPFTVAIPRFVLPSPIDA